MGKKAKTIAGIAKAAERKVDKATLPPPPPKVEEEHGSAKLLEEPSLPGSGFKILEGEGYDDGGVADLALLIDLEDSVQRRRRGDSDYFSALKNDLLPRATRGQMAHMSRREQKVSLAQLLFSEDDNDEDKGPSEIFMDHLDVEDDKKTLAHREERLQQGRAALRLSLLLRESACASLSLAELCKRKLNLTGKAGAEEALRCANKSIEIAGDGFWDGDDVAIESVDDPKVPPNFEKNATSPGLGHPQTLKYMPLRVSHLCLRSALLQRGNALAALGRDEEARASYEKVFPLLQDEPRCARVDWERHSLHVNIGNTYSRSGDFEHGDEHYTIAENLGKDHLGDGGGSTDDGKNMVAVAKRARAFALNRIGKKEEARAILKEVVEQQIKDNIEAEMRKKEEEKKEKEKEKENNDKNDKNGNEKD